MANANVGVLPLIIIVVFVVLLFVFKSLQPTFLHNHFGMVLGGGILIILLLVGHSSIST